MTGEHFCDRSAELRDMVDLMLDGQNLILTSPRRYGKTSLLLRAVAAVRRRGGSAAYASLARVSGRRDVVETLLDAVLRDIAGGLRRRTRRVNELLEHLRVRPDLVIGGDGTMRATLTPSFRDEGTWNGLLEDVLRTLSRAGGERPVALVIDEFQRVADFGASFPGIFKAMADELGEVSLAFSGSRQHVMRELTASAGAPLLGMGEPFSLAVIPEAEMVDHLCRRSADGAKLLEPAVARSIYRRADAVPNDVQRLAYAAFHAAENVIDRAAVDEGVDRIVRHQSAEYAERFGSLSPAQQRILKALAHEPVEQVYTRRFLDLVEVANDNAVRTALRVLGDRSLVARRDGRWEVSGAFFRAWLASDSRHG